VVKIRRNGERGSTKLDWLDSRHTFSFGDYYDPKHMGFSHLRVINEDWVIAGAGFPIYSHRDMESSPTCWKDPWRIKTARAQAP
jgi:redox-sensitive bicupin YhaK (pirin superfamily)